MGISGLLPLLKSIQKPCSLKKFSGQTIGVDAYGWLHRGTVACAIDLALDKPTTKYVDFAMSRVRMLIHFGVTPYIVFDGDYLPSKAGTEKERAGRRKESKQRGLDLLKVGKTSQAHLELQKAVDVTPEMARMFIEELKYHNIQYVVAPYEADSQLAYLERKGIINGILSEDSDLLVFGAKCLITKLDQYGECIEVNRNLFTACREISLAGWTDADFRHMAILSGCDYLPGIGKMGLKTAYRMLRKHKTVERVIKAAQFDGQFKVPPAYLEAFKQAENTFIYQWVYCPFRRELVHLTDLEQGIDLATMPYIGEKWSQNIALGVSQGDLNPNTKEPIQVQPRNRPFSKPLRPAYRTQTAPDLKSSKPIDSFFRPTRMPLAELDPNSFTPSPKQQQLLRQNTGSWAAVPVPSSQQRSSIINSVPPPRRTLSEPFRGNQSAPHLSKKRMCSDTSAESPTKYTKIESGTSKFFGSPQPDDSPSLRTIKSRKKEEFDIYSSDIDEEMAKAADAAVGSTSDQDISFTEDDYSFSSTRRSSSKKMKVFKDDSLRSSITSVTSGSQSTSITRSNTELSQDSTLLLTPATSFGSQTPEPQQELSMGTSVDSLHSLFAYPAASTPSRPPASITMKSGYLQRKPLQRSQTGLGSSRLRNSLKQPRRSSLSTSPPLLASALEEISAADCASADKGEVVVPDSDHEDADQVDVVKETPRSKVKGSEDLIIPDSEAESDNSPPRSMLDLSRFTFAKG